MASQMVLRLAAMLLTLLSSAAGAAAPAGTRAPATAQQLTMNARDWHFTGGSDWSSHDPFPAGSGTPPGTLVAPPFNVTAMTNWMDTTAFYTAASFGDARIAFHFRWGDNPYTTAGLVIKAANAQDYYIVEFPVVAG
jgi:hypothetical protein